MSLIAAIRRGFLYQDRVAVAIYLQELQNRNILRYYVDFPFGKRKSIDIRHVGKDGAEIAYEIKSGKEFKKDKRNKNSSEVRNAILDLKEYLDANPGTILKIVIKKSFQNKISDYWSKIESIKCYALSNADTHDKLEWLLAKLWGIPGISNIEELYDFLKRIELDAFPDDEVANETDKFSKIDDVVISAIDDFARSLEAESCSYEYPSEILMYQLYHLASLHGGYANRDIHPHFLNGSCNISGVIRHL